MKKPLLMFFASLILFSCANAQEQTILYNTNIVDVETGNLIPKQTITIEKGVITKIKKAGNKLPKNAIDLTGKYVMPGLIDSHTHWANFTPDSTSEKEMIDTYLAEGVTTVRDAGGNADKARNFNDRLKRGEVVGPTIYYSSFWAGPEYFEMSRGEDPTNVYWNRVVTDNSDFEAFVKDAKDNGCTGLKLYHSISPEALNKIVPLCNKYGIKAWGHFSMSPTQAIDVVKAGVETVSHAYIIECDKFWKIPGYDTLRFSAPEKQSRLDVYNEMIKRGTYLDATIKICMENDMLYAVDYLKEALAAGVKRIVAGTDWIGKGEDGKMKSVFLDELDLYIEKCGMKNVDVLKSSTLYGAEILGLKDKIGVIKVGAEADILVLNANPLESVKALRKMDMLFIDGKKVR